MASLEASERAITALNNSTPPGAVQSLIVRYAESAAEKAMRLSRREAKTMQRVGGGPGGGGMGLPSGLNSMGGSGGMNGGMHGCGMNGGMGLAPDHLQQALNALSLGGGAGLQPAPLVPQGYQPQILSSICIKGGFRVCVEGGGGW